MMRRFFKITQKIAVFVLVLLLTFTNGFSYFLLALNSVYENSNIVDKILRLQSDKNIVDNFKPLEHAILKLKIPEAKAAGQGDGKVIYGEGTVTTPRERNWTSGAFDASESNLPVAAATIRHTVLKSGTTRDEMLVGIQTTGGTLYIQRWNGSAWSNEWNVTVGDGNLPRFDIAYEKTSGEALVVYTANVATTNEIIYRVWNGTSWVGPTNYDAVRTSGIVDSIQVVAAHNGTTDDLAMAWGDRNLDLSANYWNGATNAWVGEPAAVLETVLATTGGVAPLTTQSFNLAFESVSGELLVVWGVDGIRDLGKYVTRTAGAGGSWGSVVNVDEPGFTEEGTDSSLTPDPDSDYIAYANTTNDGADADFGIWTGAGWSTAVSLDGAIGVVAAGTNNNAVTWVTSGGQTRAVVVYDDAAVGIGWRTYNKNTNTWTAQTDSTVAPAAAATDIIIRMRTNPFNKAELILIQVDGNSDLFAKKLTFDGTNFTWSSVEPGGVALETTVSSITGLSADFFYYRFIPPLVPDATSYTNNTEGGLTDGGRIGQQITITGTNLAGGGSVTAKDTCTAGAANGCVRIADYTVPAANIPTWTNTSIVLTIPSAITVFGGSGTTCATAGSNGICVTQNGTNDLSGALGFFVYPDITSVSPSGVGEGREGASVTITGTKFQATQASGSVQFTNCAASAQTATVGTWGDTSITVTVPAGIDDNDDACDVVVNSERPGPITKSDTSVGFIVVPDVTGMTTCAVGGDRDSACPTNEAQEYVAGDTFGLIQLNGNHFGTSAGTVTFTGGFGSIAGTVHATGEGACSVGGWAGAATSVCVEVNSTISNTVYDGTVTLDRLGGSGTDIDTISLHILPRIVTNTPTADIEGNVIQIDGDHLCQTGTCPPTPPTVDYIAYFGSTQALAADFVTTPNCTGASKWGHSQVCVKVPSGTPAGTQKTKLQGQAAAPLRESQRKDFTRQSTVPSDPTNLRQFKNDGTTVITTGTGKTNETTVKLKADLSASLSIAMIVQVEVKKTGTPFDATGIVDGTGCTGTACADATATVTGLTDTTPDGLYHWRARTKNTTTLEVSNWVNFNAGSTAFIVDLTAPAITNISSGTPGSNTATITWDTIAEASTTQVEYKKNGGAADCALNSTSVTNPVPPGVTSHSVTLSNLDSGSTYFYRVRSKDEATNEAISSPCNSFATASVSQPGKTTKFHIAGATGAITAATNYFFGVVAPETSVSVKSAFVEVTGIVSGGSNPITIKVNGVASRAYSVSATNPTKFKFVYQITSPGTEANLNLNDITPCTNDNTPGVPPETPPCNTLTVTPGTGMTVHITSARIIIHYGYTP